MQYRESIETQTQNLNAGMKQKADALADASRRRFQDASRYFRENDARTMATDLGGVIKTHPMQSFLLGVGVGYLLLRLFRD